MTPHSRAVLEALFVAFLWSTSWVLIKIGLEDIPALTFAGLRYMLAFLILLPFTLRSRHLASLRGLSRRSWLQLIALGILLFAVAQGGQFIGLFYLPSATVNLLLSFTAILVAILGVFTLGERPTKWQWIGSAIYVLGVLFFFRPGELQGGQVIGYVAVIIGLLATTGASLLGRQVNRSLTLSPAVVTVVTMGIGATLLFSVGIAVQGLPKLTITHWAMILWLAAVNSAFAFTLYNRTLRTLSAMESSIIINTMLIWIPLLAWIFLGESLTVYEIAGLVLAAIGVVVVQVYSRSSP